MTTNATDAHAAEAPDQRVRRPTFAVAVQGLFETSDSIGYDAVFQYQALASQYGKARVRLFAERANPRLYPGIEIRDAAELFGSGQPVREATLIYHYCDGWPAMEAYLSGHGGPIHLRWHNNTPPWFYTTVNMRSVARTVAGFEHIVAYCADPRIRFWVNSAFTARQLEALGGDPKRMSVVYPASRYLSQPARAPSNRSFPAEGSIRLLFVGRVVAHKGHKHVLALAEYIQANFGRRVFVDFAGREDGAAHHYNDLLRALAKEGNLDVTYHGEVSEAALRALYDRADVFVCLSEHEGFGLPVFEAMRRDLPVAAWARTALAEFLRGHALAFETLDFGQLAAGILALASPTFRQAILRRQRDIIAGYTRDIVLRQIHDAVEPGARAASLSDGAHQGRDSADPDGGIPPEVRRWARDEGENYVTLSDLESYRRLLDTGGANPLAGLEDHGRLRAAAHVDLRADAFFTTRGRHADGAIVFACQSVGRRHVVYGPYVPCPPGRYAVEFDVAFDPPVAWPTVLKFDVNSDLRGVIRTRLCLAPAGARQARFARLTFRIDTPGETLEFRMSVVASGARQGCFNGVRITRI